MAEEESLKSLEMFNRISRKEIEFFKRLRTSDLKKAFKDYSEFQISYHSKCLNSWKELLQSMESQDLENSQPQEFP